MLDEVEDDAIGCSFDLGLTIGDIVSFKSPPSHRFFSSSSALRSP